MKNYEASYQLVDKETRINEDLQPFDDDFASAVTNVVESATVQVENDKYTVYTKKELTRWQKIQIGMEIAKIPYMRGLRKITKDENGKITSSRLFGRIKDKK